MYMTNQNILIELPGATYLLDVEVIRRGVAEADAIHLDMTPKAKAKRVRKGAK